MSNHTPGSPAETTAPLLRIEGAVKRFGDLVAVDNVSFEVEHGVFGLLGANGAGKSTLLKAILDLVRLDSGEIFVQGHSSGRDGVAARRTIGYFPEELRLYDRLTGEELLDLVSGLKAGSESPVGEERSALGKEEHRRLMELFDLWPKRRLLISEYSLGMRKKIGLAAALLGSPPLVILDEPLNGLDAESMRILRLEIEAMVERGTTFLLSSHVMSFVERICDAMAIMRGGRIVARGTASDLRRQTGLMSEPFEDVFLALAVDGAGVEASTIEPPAGEHG